MTICAGFICTDGLLLTADTEVTGQGKYDAQKIRRTDFAGGLYVITGAGNHSFLGMASDMIEEELYRQQEAMVEETDDKERQNLFYDAVQQSILRVHRDHIASYPYGGDPPQLSLILGVHFNKWSGDLRLLHCGMDGGVYWTDDDIFEGSGADIARLFSNIICGERLPVDVMRPISIFCLHQAKLGAAGCGGSSEAFTLPMPNRNSLWDEKGISELPHLAMRLCLVDARDTRITKEEFRKRVDDFRARVVAIRDAIEQEAISRKFIIEVLRKQQLTPPSSVPVQPPEQSDDASPGTVS